MWDQLGISAGTAMVVLIALCFIKWAVKSGVKEALQEREEERGLKAGPGGRLLNLFFWKYIREDEGI